MRKGQNRKVNSVGKASCLGLLALGLALVNPVGSLSVFAEEAGDYGLDKQAMSASIVGISFSPASGSTSLTPITSAGQSAQINVKATVSVANSGGYSVYLKSNSQNLVGVNNPNNVIPGIAGSTTYDNLSTNTWGYASAEGTAVPEGASYKAISVSGQGDKIAENASNKIVSDTKEIMLSFAAKIGDDMPADTYKSTVTMSVVSSPAQLALGDISDMQQMTSEICENTAPSASKQLRDVRDGKYYWVTKLADNKCWMTQNLDLDLSTKVALTPEDSDVKSNWAPEFDTATVADENTILASNIGTRSWSLGDVRITNPTASSNCGSPKNDAKQCPDQFTPYLTPTTLTGEEGAHYILGNHYQWNAATAGTGGTITTGQAESSICPKGWRLPTSDVSAEGTFAGLVDAYSIGTNVSKLASSPLYFVAGGYVNQDPVILLVVAGISGNYWSSTPVSNITTAYFLSLYSPNTLAPSYSAGRDGGRSVRCVAR